MRALAVTTAKAPARDPAFRAPRKPARFGYDSNFSFGLYGTQHAAGRDPARGCTPQRRKAREPEVREKTRCRAWTRRLPAGSRGVEAELKAEAPMGARGARFRARVE
jgi:hypothetical protein